MADVLKSTRRADSPAGGPTGPSAPSRSRLSRCNAPRTQPVAPDTAWGRLRGQTSWSLRELARRSGVNAGEISKIERGLACPTPDQARALLAAIDYERILEEMRGRG